MITAPQLIEEQVKQVSFLEEALSNNLINLSSLARQLKPMLDKKLYKDIKEGTIVMALKRLSTRLQKSRNQTLAPIRNLGDITVRSNLTEYTFQKSDSFIKDQRTLLDDLDKQPGVFLTFTQGVLETTLIINSALQHRVEKIFQKDKLISKFTNLSSITISLPKETVEMPGVYYQILKRLAWEGINIIEVLSSFSELSIIVKNEDVDRAFSVIKNLK